MTAAGADKLQIDLEDASEYMEVSSSGREFKHEHIKEEKSMAVSFPAFPS